MKEKLQIKNIKFCSLLKDVILGKVNEIVNEMMNISWRKVSYMLIACKKICVLRTYHCLGM